MRLPGRAGRPKARHEHGSIMVLSALVITVLVAAAAMAVDIGKQSNWKRQLHTIADLAAQDASYGLGTIPSDSCTSNATLNLVQNLATQSAQRNLLPDRTTVATVTTQIGTWDPINKVFVALDCPNTDDSGSEAVPDMDADNPSDATAVQVTATTTEHRDIIAGTKQLTASAVVSNIGRAGVQVGSYAAQADLENSMAGALLGLSSPETVTVAGWSGLASADVSLDKIRAAGSFGTIDNLLNASMTVGQLLTITASAFDPSGSSTTAAAVAMRKLAADASAATTTQAQTQITLKKLIGFGVGIGNGNVAETQDLLNLKNLVTAAPEVALINGTNVVSATLPTTITIPGTTNFASTLKLTAIEVPQAEYGPVGTTAKTAQIRAQLTISGTVSVPIPSALLPTLVNFNIPIALQGFGGTGEITRIYCSTDEVDILATPIGGVAAIGNVSNLANPLPSSFSQTNLLSILGVPVLSGSTEVNVSGGPAQTFAFTGTIWTGAPPARGPQSTSSPGVGPLLDSSVTGNGTILNDVSITSGSPTMTSASAHFTAADVGETVSGYGIPSGSHIASFQSSTQVTMSANATQTVTNDQVTIGRSSSGNVTLLGGSLSLANLETYVLNPVLNGLDNVLTPVDQALGVSVAGLDVWNLAYPNTAAPPGVDCTSPLIVQ